MTTLNGLPAHALLVHAIVVLVPLTAVLLVLTTLWPAARQRLGIANAVLATVTLAAVPLTTEAGDWLEHHVQRSALVSQHTNLGDTLLPWVGGLFLIAVAVVARDLLGARQHSTARGPGTAAATELRRLPIGGRAVTAALAALAIVVGAGAVVDTYLIGESGARAAWTDHFSQQQLWGRQQG